MYKIIYKVTDGFKCCLKSPRCVRDTGSDLSVRGRALLVWFLLPAPLQREACAVALLLSPIQHQLALAALGPQSLETLRCPREGSQSREQWEEPAAQAPSS